jgi:hypothetical protein
VLSPWAKRTHTGWQELTKREIGRYNHIHRWGGGRPGKLSKSPPIILHIRAKGTSNRGGML